MITLDARPRHTDTQTDGRTNTIAIARRFVLRTHRALKYYMFEYETAFISPRYYVILTLNV